jgi:D-inositol-3-phosphate glycosyltransferase
MEKKYNMKIAMLSIHSCPIGELGTKDTGGMSVYIRETAKELGQTGNHVDIYTRNHGLKHDEIVRLSENVRLIHIKGGDDSDMSKLAVYPHVNDFAATLEEIRFKEKIHYDIIHSHYWLSGLIGRLAQNWWDVPHIIMFHTLGLIKNNLNIGRPEPDFRICNEKAIVHTCDKIIAATAREKQDLIQLYKAASEKIGVIPCGVNTNLFHPIDKKNARKHLGYDMDENIILYVGRVEPLKGIDRLLKSVSCLKDRMPIKLIIVGGDDRDQPEMQEIINLAMTLKIIDSVDFAGRVIQDDLPLYYNAADALVVSSLYESFGLVALEALSCGTPVVSTAVGGMKTIIRERETGLLVSGDTVESMGKCIYDIISNRKKYQANSISIRNSILRLSWSNIANLLIEEYSSSIKEYCRSGRINKLEEDFDLKRASCG